MNTPAGSDRYWDVNFSAEGRVIDTATLERHIREHQASVWHYLRTLGCDPDVASDLTQETFLVALRKGLRFEEHAAARRYLRQTAHYLFLDHCRSNGRSKWEAESQAWARAVDGAWEESGEGNLEVWLEALRVCREKLEGRRSEVVALFYGQRLSRAEIAGRLRMKENGVKTMLQRVREGLRRCMDSVIKKELS